LRQTASVLYIAIDSLISARGTFLPGLNEFTAALDHHGIPAVWLTSRSRLQFDEPRRKLGHSHPFVAEDGCGIYLPEDYFHLRPSSARSPTQKTATLRLGRFTCVPVAEILPAAVEALESLSKDAKVPIVTLRSLSPRELAQNTGLRTREASLARERDFDDLFFFAGVTEREIQRFLDEGRGRNLQFRQHGVLWSIAIGASIQRCVRELSKLYDRALRYHARSIGVAKQDAASALFPSCDRAILLTREECGQSSANSPAGQRVKRIALRESESWDRLLEAIVSED
jgi:predicted mannosyl-3-phosphoglycerate phosphatase (HAD superfamily)